MIEKALRAEWLKLSRLRLFRVVVLFGAGLSLFWLAFALFMLERGALSVREELLSRLVLPGAFFQGFSLAAGFGETFTAIVAAAFVANEFSWGTWRLLLPTGLPRWQALLAKFLALLIGTIVFVLVVACVPILAAPALSRVLDQPLFAPPTGEHWQLELVLLPLRTVIALVAPMTLAMALVTWTRSQAVAVGVTIGLSVSEGVLAALLQGFGG